MINLLLVTTAPVFIILIYIYYRDKYEKEPLKLLFEGLLAGGVIVFPIIYAEQLMMSLGSAFTGLAMAGYNAFFVAALCEEAFKLFAVLLLIWKNPNFNEKFDGIVYAVFVSLGFALVENFFYVFKNDNGMTVGLMRAFTAVPAHAMFGIIMGYWLGMARFVQSKRMLFLFCSFFYPFLFHGLYDFVLMSQHVGLLILFIPLFIFIVIRARKRIREVENQTVFNPKGELE